MIKIIIVLGLVFFALASIAGVYAASKKSDGEKPDGLSWSEYGRVEQGELSFTIRLNETITSGSASIPVSLEFKNISPRTLHLFKVHTGDDGQLYNPVLDVEHNGETVTYRGKMAKIAPDKTWYSNVKPGKSFVNTFDLLEYYPMSLNKGDRITIKYTRLQEVLDTQSSAASFTVE